MQLKTLIRVLLFQSYLLYLESSSTNQININLSEETGISLNSGSINDTPSGLTVTDINADILLNKWEEITVIAELDKPDIIIVTETLPKNSKSLHVDAKEFV